MTEDIIITRTFNAPAELVFKVWTTPEHIKQWWGPEGFSCPEAKIDLRVGGQYHYCMRTPDGNDAWSGGVFKEIVPNKRLVVTDYFADEQGNKVSPTRFGLSADFPEESTVIVTFDEHEGKTTLSVHYSPETQEAYDAMLKTQMVEGWNSSLDKFQAHVENLDA